MVPLLKVLLSPRGTVQVDPRTNTLIITDLQSRLDQVATLTGSLDRAQPQVEIEARIVRTTSTYVRALGVQWGFNGNVSPALGNTTGLAFPNNGSLSGRAGGVQGPNGSSTAVNLPASGATSGVGLALGSINGSFNLDAALTALESNGHVKLLSSPKISTLNNIEAEIAQGLRVPFQTTANNTITTEFVDAALTLRVNPQITDADTVIMKISVDKGSLGEVTPGGQAINTQRANTTVLVNDGETTVIGGIFEGTDSKTENSTPGLSKIPIIKWLFKSDDTRERNDELLIFITPRIVRR
jgi:type IV pilus assembly protein PilQ